MRDDEATVPNQEEIFEVLSNERRRFVLEFLVASDDEFVELRPLVTHVAARENDKAPAQLDTSDRKSVYVGLRQTHLPKMDEYNLIEYDKDRGSIRLRESAIQAQRYLEYVPDRDVPWAYHYLGISVLSGVLVGLTWLGISPFDGVQGIVLAGLIVIAFALSSCVHAIRARRKRRNIETVLEYPV